MLFSLLDNHLPVLFRPHTTYLPPLIRHLLETPYLELPRLKMVFLGPQTIMHLHHPSHLPRSSICKSTTYVPMAQEPLLMKSLLHRGSSHLQSLTVLHQLPLELPQP